MRAALPLDVAELTLHAGARRSARRLFTGLSMPVRAGECWVVLGPNGSGKSSLLAALAGLMPLAGGSVHLDGKAVADWSPQELARWRAWCPQFWSDPFPASVAQTVRLARDRGAWWCRGSATADDHADDARVMAFMSRLELLALADADVRRLSGGERQRVAVATALLQDAPLLLLDEPASHMDLAHQQRLMALLREHADVGGSVVVSLHDLDFAAGLASHVVLLDGRGGARSGEAAALLQPTLLSQAFGVAIERTWVGDRHRFWVGPPPVPADARSPALP